MRTLPYLILIALAGLQCGDATVGERAEPLADASADVRATDDLSAVDAAGETTDREASPAPEDPYTRVVWQLHDGRLPMPNDMFRDPAAARLTVPVSDDLSPAETALRRWMNEQEGWSTTAQMSVEFDGPIDPATVTPATVQVWRWGSEPTRLSADEAIWAVSEDAQRVTIDPVRSGWQPGATYVGLVRGGSGGVLDVAGEPVRASPVFEWALGAADLPDDDFRSILSGYLDVLGTAVPAADQVPREEVAVAWPFTVTTAVELLMDRLSQRAPLPFDLLLEPSTGRVHLEHADWDSQLEADAKTQLNELDGFGLSSRIHVVFSGPIDPDTVSLEHVSVYDVETASALPLVGAAMLDERHLVIEIEEDALPLPQTTTFAVVLREGPRGADGADVVPQIVGALLIGEHPVFDDGVSTIASLDGPLAERIEFGRARVAPLLDDIGRDGVLAAWSFTTMDAFPALREAVGLAEAVGVDAAPIVDEVVEISSGLVRGPIDRARAFEVLFPDALPIDPVAASARAVYAPRLLGVERLVWGRLPIPYFLDPVTRRWRDDGAHELRETPFLLTVPQNATAPVPVVVFAHAVVTDRRFLLTIAGALARRGMAAMAIDLPFHGERTVCVDDSLVALPNFLPEALQSVVGQTGPVVQLPPCVSGDEATCAPTGACLGPDGEPEPFNTFVRLGDNTAIMDMQVASGAAFLDLSDMAYMKDHILQALVELGAQRRSLQTADWSAIAGVELKTDVLRFAGQSLGSIIGLVFTAVDPHFHRLVFNVPGGDLVELFLHSTFFEGQMERFLLDTGLDRDTYEFERLLDVARWVIDSVDPQAVAHTFRGKARKALLQLSTGDLIIPNQVTRTIQRVSELPLLEYPSPLHADLVVPLLGLGMLDDLADFLGDGQLP